MSPEWASSRRARTFWFALAATVILCGDLLVVLLPYGVVDPHLIISYGSLPHLSLVPSPLSPERQSWLLEAGVVVDLAILIPAVYWLLCRGPWKMTLVRVVSLACLGIWGASLLVPADQQHLLDVMRPVRNLGTVGLVLLELFVLFKIYRAVFTGTSKKDVAADLHTSAGMPIWASRLMAWEAALMHKLWRWCREVIRAVFGSPDP